MDGSTTIAPRIRRTLHFQILHPRYCTHNLIAWTAKGLVKNRNILSHCSQISCFFELLGLCSCHCFALCCIITVIGEPLMLVSPRALLHYIAFCAWHTLCSGFDVARPHGMIAEVHKRALRSNPPPPPLPYRQLFPMDIIECLTRLVFEENKTVTYKQLSHTVGVTAAKAKSALNDLIQSRSDDLSPTYVVSGVNPATKTYSLQIVEANKLNDPSVQFEGSKCEVWAQL